MAVSRIGADVGLDINESIGLTADTTAYLEANTTLANGSTYRELDGAKRVYQILNGVWYEFQVRLVPAQVLSYQKTDVLSICLLKDHPAL